MIYSLNFQRPRGDLSPALFMLVPSITGEEPGVGDSPIP